MAFSPFSRMRPDLARRVPVCGRHFRLLAGAVGVQFLVGIGLRLIPLPALRKVSRRVRPLVDALLPGPEAQVVWAIEATGRRLPVVSTCLVRALVGEMRLSSPERPLTLVIGVKRTGSGCLLSHAWLRDRERVLIGGPLDASMAPLVQWESAA